MGKFVKNGMLVCPETFLSLKKVCPENVFWNSLFPEHQSGSNDFITKENATIRYD